MPRYVYITESTGDETGLDRIHSAPGKAVSRLREYYGHPIPRGSVARLKAGETIWAEDPETEMYDGCARRVPVF